MASDRDTKPAAPGVAEEFIVRVRMAATPDVSDELLEQLTILVEDALAEHATALAPGGSASANFMDHMIELDFTVEAESPEEMHRKVGEVVRIALEAVPRRDPQSVAFAGSVTSSVLALA
jgi:hypothetical protein